MLPPPGSHEPVKCGLLHDLPSAGHNSQNGLRFLVQESETLGVMWRSQKEAWFPMVSVMDSLGLDLAQEGQQRQLLRLPLPLLVIQLLVL